MDPENSLLEDDFLLLPSGSLGGNDNLLNSKKGSKKSLPSNRKNNNTMPILECVVTVEALLPFLVFFSSAFRSDCQDCAFPCECADRGPTTGCGVAQMN